MSVTRLLRFSLVAAAAMGCSSDATSPQLRAFVYAAAAAACGPADGPAVAIYLTSQPAGDIEPSAPRVRVYVPVAASELTAHMWPIGSSTEAAAWFEPDASTFEIAESGYLIVSSVDADQSINGSFDLQFPNAGRITNGFHAKWLPNNYYCF